MKGRKLQRKINGLKKKKSAYGKEKEEREGERKGNEAAGRGGTVRKDKSILIKMKCVVAAGPSTPARRRLSADRQRLVALPYQNETPSQPTLKKSANTKYK